MDRIAALSIQIQIAEQDAVTMEQKLRENRKHTSELRNELRMEIDAEIARRREAAE